MPKNLAVQIKKSYKMTSRHFSFTDFCAQAKPSRSQAIKSNKTMNSLYDYHMISGETRFNSNSVNGP